MLFGLLGIKYLYISVSLRQNAVFVVDGICSIISIKQSILKGWAIIWWMGWAGFWGFAFEYGGSLCNMETIFGKRWGILIGCSVGGLLALIYIGSILRRYLYSFCSQLSKSALILPIPIPTICKIYFWKLVMKSGALNVAEASVPHNDNLSKRSNKYLE